MREVTTATARAGREDAAQIGTLIRELREARGWNQAALADAAGVSRSAISALETGGITNPTVGQLTLVAHALDTTLARLTRATCPHCRGRSRCGTCGGDR